MTKRVLNPIVMPLTTYNDHRADIDGFPVYGWGYVNETLGVIESYYTVDFGSGIVISREESFDVFVDVDFDLYKTLKKLHDTLKDSNYFYPIRDFADNKEVELNGETYCVYAYLDEHRIENQTLIAGIPVNPKHRIGFSNCPNEIRPCDELKDWLGMPFIETWEEKFFIKCLDGEVCDSPTLLGVELTLVDAIGVAKKYLSAN